LKTGTKGVFKVSVDGEVVFDKASVGRLPQGGEAAASVETRLGSPVAWRRTKTF
jgi:predicted Rdx family selenoprotein